MRLSNKDILEILNNYDKNFNESLTINLPIKIGYYIQKNIRKLKNIKVDIDKMLVYIGEKYGTLEEDGYVIKPENMTHAQKELDNLYGITQEINIDTISLNDFPNDLFINMNQLDTLMFMIKEEKETEENE